MRTFTQDNDTVTCFDYSVYQHERNIIEFQHDMEESGGITFVKMWTNLEGSYGSPIAKYHLDKDGFALIDMTEYIRAYPSVSTIYVECEDCEKFTITLSVVGLRPPKDPLAPANLSGIVIDVPSAIIEPIPAPNSMKWSVYLEAYSDVSGYKIGSVALGTTIKRVFVSGTGKLAVKKDNTTIRTINIRPMVCGKKYAAVRWKSYTGTLRVSTFEVRGVNVAAKDRIELETADGSYNTLKGSEDSFKLCLDGLDRYDMWYYSDIIRSSKVEVALEGCNFVRVDVATDSVTIPDGDAGDYNTLEIKVRYRKYDSISM